MPLFSIITINYNNAEGLKKTIGSVIQQTFNDFEYIIIDGASTDTSLEIIKSFTSIPPDIYQLSTINHQSLISYWISEPDTGIYNAMNKGIAVASGKYLLFLNSGDKLYGMNVLEESASLINRETEIASGRLLLIDEAKNITLVPPSDLSLYQAVYNGLMHPNTFIRFSLFAKYGKYNENNRIVSDWEFYLFASGLNNCIYQKLDIIISEFLQDGVSSLNSKLITEETKKAVNRIIAKPILDSIKRLHYLELLQSKPEYILIEKSKTIRKLLIIIYKINKKLIQNFKRFLC